MEISRTKSSLLSSFIILSTSITPVIRQPARFVADERFGKFQKRTGYISRQHLPRFGSSLPATVDLGLGRRALIQSIDNRTHNAYDLDGVNARHISVETLPFGYP